MIRSTCCKGPDDLNSRVEGALGQNLFLLCKDYKGIAFFFFFFFFFFFVFPGFCLDSTLPHA